MFLNKFPSIKKFIIKNVQINSVRIKMKMKNSYVVNLYDSEQHSKGFSC